MRVLYSFPDTLGKPGIGTTALNQVKGLIASGAEVIVCCTHATVDPPGARDVVETLTLAGRRIPHRALGVDRAFAYHDVRVARTLRRSTRTPPDVVHGWPLGSIETFRAAKSTGIASAREVPNTHTEEAYRRAADEAARLEISLPAGHSHSFNARRLRREEAEYRSADALLVPSEHVAQTFLSRGFPDSKLRRHRYGFDPERFPDPGPRTRAPGSDLQCVFVGRLEPRKGLHLALRAWADAGVGARGSLRIYGSYAPGYRSVIEPLLEAAPGVEFMGFTDDVGAVLRGADVLVLPSLEEGSALVTYEAQASGCALVVSDAAGAQVEHMGNALVHDAGDVKTLTEHLRVLAADPGLLSAMQAESRRRRPQLTWESSARRLIEIYRDISVMSRGGR